MFQRQRTAQLRDGHQARPGHHRPAQELRGRCQRPQGEKAHEDGSCEGKVLMIF